MPDIQAFRGIRYDLGHVGSLGQVVAPPYDVIDETQQKQLYERHPANIIRLILNRPEPGDDENARYARAARFLNNWQLEGVLFTEPDPAIYVYHQQFDYRGQTFVRRGFMCRCRLERLGEGKIFPHEDTLPGPKKDRLALTRACRANLSQVFGLYPDPDNEAQRILEQEIVGKTPLEATDDLGTVHRFWPVTNAEIITRLTAAMGPKPVFIADGHHRYETACNYRDEVASSRELDVNDPLNFVLMYLNSMGDPGLIVLPTHRLFRGMPPIDSDELTARLGDYFDVRPAGEGSDVADMAWREIDSKRDQGTMAFFTQEDERWVIARFTERGRQKMAEVASERSEAWRGLGVGILHRRYVHLIKEVVDGLNTSEFQLAAVVLPASIEQIREISELGERMPAKSTYFYPKLLSGLVINPLAS
jgi:uncharacterized protein (DUF1015 family)